MLSSVRNSERVVQMNILIVRAFVKLREVLATHKDLVREIENIRRRQEEQGEQIAAIIETSISSSFPGLFRRSSPI